MAAHDIAIYAPMARGIYERGIGFTGGAERQTALLARTLAERGLSVAHVVYRLRDPLPSPHPRLDIVQRRRATQVSGVRAGVREAGRVLQALHAADARVYLIRMASPVVAVTAAYCRARDRRLIFAGANDGDFTLEVLGGARRRAAMFRAGVQRADAIVVQSRHQRALAENAYPSARVTEIPSFVEPAPPALGERGAFVWIGRVVPYKEPLRYLDLAAALPAARFRMIAVEMPSEPALADEVRRRAATLPNVELLTPRPHAATMALLDDTVAVVSTSRLEGMPNVFLEAWSRGVPVLSLQFDPDGRIERRGLGVAAHSDWTAFVAGAAELWLGRRNGAPQAERARRYVEEVHGPAAVGDAWAALVTELVRDAAGA
jgi:glycosyltransferase involved in cell wall biosynthesis